MTDTLESVSTRSWTIAVGAAYALQGIGYAVVVTAVPSFQQRLDIGEGTVSIILLGVCLAAASGSVLADLVALRRSSRRAVQVGFAIQVLGLVGVALAPTLPLFVLAVLCFGVGLGTIDAAAAMQGVLVQRARGVPLLGRFFATATAGSITGAIVMSVSISARGGAAFALLAAAVLQGVGVFVIARRLDARRAARESGREAGDSGSSADRAPLPRGAIAVAGFVILAAFTIDSGASSWSSVHLTDLGAVAALAPLGYAAYQGAVLLSRLALDPVQRRFGARLVLATALVLGALGGFVVALVPVPLVAVGGFVLSGFAVGAMVPLGFGLAGQIDPARSDEVIARVNLFNYAGAVFGAVALGLLLEAVGASVAFLVPVLLLLAALPALRSMPHGREP